MAKPWDGLISDEEQRAYRAAGFGGRSGLGVRPGLLIIDVQYRTTGTRRLPFWDAIGEFRTSCGDAGWQAIDHIVPLLRLFRARGYPVSYSTLTKVCALGEGPEPAAWWGTRPLYTDGGLDAWAETRCCRGRKVRRSAGAKA